MPIQAGTTTPAAIDASPDWNQISQDVHCPLCGYNLRGLIEPRCPECGFKFNWKELLDPRRRSHPYLFEHHPTRSVWSFFRTLVGGMTPIAFWSSLHPSQTSRLRRLILYALITTSPLWAIWLAAMAQSARVTLESARRNGWIVPSDWWHHPMWLSWICSNCGELTETLPCWLAWPVFSLAGLLIFQWSMRRARLRMTHILRVVIYSFDLLWITALVPALFIFNCVISGLSPMGAGDSLSLINSLVGIALVIATIRRLFCAHRLYLRFDHPLAVVLSSQIIAALAMWKLSYMLQGM
jgi:hypothetical protein